MTRGAWRSSWITAATVCGMFGGPALAGIVQGRSVPGIMGIIVVPVCFAALRADGARIWGWGRAESLWRSAVVFAVGGVLWVLPGAWSIPDSVLGFPFNWLVLTVPFALAAVVVSPRSIRRHRIVAAALLALVGVLWPALCGMAAAEVRRDTGIPADALFFVHVDGLRADAYRVRPGGAVELGYFAADDDRDGDYGVVLISWPDIPNPCDHFPAGAACPSRLDGTWTVTDRDDDQFLLTRRGGRDVAVEVPSLEDAISPERLHAILAAAHIADGHDLLEIANGS